MIDIGRVAAVRLVFSSYNRKIYWKISLFLSSAKVWTKQPMKVKN